MRPLFTILLLKLSICSASPPAPASTSAVVTPRLRENLSVSRQPASRGEPVALRGGEKMLCTLRKDTPPACIGEIALALQPVNTDADDGRYAKAHAEHPVSIEGIDLRHLDAAGYHRCVFSPGQGPVECWWRDVAQHEGQHPQPLSFENAQDIAAEAQTCVIDSAGTVACSGSPTCVGPEHSDEVFDPTRPVDVPGVNKARLIDKALHMGCVVREDSTVACWGKILERAECTPNASVVPTLDQVVDIAVGDYSACALRADNRVLCWGNNEDRTLGVAEPIFSKVPIEVREAHPAVKIDSSSRGYAVLRVDGSVIAWGSGVVLDEKQPPQRVDLAHPAVDLVAMDGLVCALLVTGDVECEGYKVDFAVKEGRPRPPFEGKAPWVEAPLYRLAPAAAD